MLVKVLLGYDYIHHRGLQGRGGRITRAGGVDGPVGATQQAYKSRSIVEVHDGGYGAARCDGLSLRVVAYERRYFVAVLLQLGECMRSDKPVASASATFMGPNGPSLHVKE